MHGTWLGWAVGAGVAISLLLGRAGPVAGVEPGDADPARFEPGPCFLADCSGLEHDDSIVFGHLRVPESRERSDGRQLALAVVILKATGAQPQPDPVMYLPGGPGVSGIRRLEVFRDHPLRQERDIVLMDFRGLGYSEPALCPDLGRGFWTLLASQTTAEDLIQAKVAHFLACRETLVEAGVDLGAYHSAAIVADLDDLRRALGASAWNLYGVSYGTRIALTYLRDRPEAVRSAILDSAVPLGTRHMLEVATAYQRTLAGVFQACAGDPVCHDAAPRLEERFRSASRDLQREPLVVPMASMKSGSGLPGDAFTVDFHDMHLAFHQLLYNRESYPILPLLVDAFAERDVIALGNLLGRFSDRLDRFSFGHFILVSRHDNGIYLDDPIPGDQDLVRGLSYLMADIAAAQAWQSPMGGSEEMVPVRSDRPVLILAGEMDPITPPTYGVIAGRTLPNSQVLRFPAVGHSVSFSTICARDIAVAFIERPDQAPDSGCIEATGSIEFIGDVYRNSRVASFGLAVLQEQRLGLVIPLVLAVLALVTFVAVMVIGPVTRMAVQILQRKNRESPPEPAAVSATGPLTRARVARVLLLVNSLLALALLAGLGYFMMATLQRNPYLLLFGLVPEARWFFALSYGLLAGTAGCCVLTAQAWRSSWWRLGARIHHGLATAGCVLVAGLVLVYRLVP